MAYVCELCGKSPVTGASIARRGRPKKEGGIGLHITGVTKRRFKPNLQRVRMRTAGGGVRRARVCTACIKKGLVVKP